MCKKQPDNKNLHESHTKGPVVKAIPRRLFVEKKKKTYQEQQQPFWPPRDLISGSASSLFPSPPQALALALVAGERKNIKEATHKELEIVSAANRVCRSRKGQTLKLSENKLRSLAGEPTSASRLPSLVSPFRGALLLSFLGAVTRLAGWFSVQ